MAGQPKSFWDDAGPVDASTRRVSHLDKLGLREEADITRLLAANHLIPHGWDMPPWQAAAACGLHLGPTLDEQKAIDAHNEEEEDVRAAQTRRYREKQAEKERRRAEEAAVR